MAVTLKAPCRVMGLREGEPSRQGRLRAWRHVGRESGAAALSLRVLEADAGGPTPGLRNGSGEEVLFVLQGRGTAHVDGWPHEIGPDTGLFVPPGAGLTLVAAGPEPLLLVSAQCPDPGPELRLEPPLLSPAGDGPRVGVTARLWERESRPSGDRWYRVLIDDAMGSSQVTQFVGAIPPGRSPDHYHEYEEVLCFLAGEGRLWADDVSAPVGPGLCAFLPRGQVHCTENTGPSELRLLGVFYPAGSPAVSYAPESRRRAAP
jgi:mannose-6-phosphate isomerase-like protein (cupin superfamily)